MKRRLNTDVQRYEQKQLFANLPRTCYGCQWYATWAHSLLEKRLKRRAYPPLVYLATKVSMPHGYYAYHTKDGQKNVIIIGRELLHRSQMTIALTCLHEAIHSFYPHGPKFRALETWLASKLGCELVYGKIETRRYVYRAHENGYDSACGWYYRKEKK